LDELINGTINKIKVMKGDELIEESLYEKYDINKDLNVLTHENTTDQNSKGD